MAPVDPAWRLRSLLLSKTSSVVKSNLRTVKGVRSRDEHEQSSIGFALKIAAARRATPGDFVAPKFASLLHHQPMVSRSQEKLLNIILSRGINMLLVLLVGSTTNGRSRLLFGVISQQGNLIGCDEFGKFEGTKNHVPLWLWPQQGFLYKIHPQPFVFLCLSWNSTLTTNEAGTTPVGWQWPGLPPPPPPLSFTAPALAHFII